MTTYTILLQDAQDYTEDDGSEFVAEIPTLITMAEERIFRDAPIHPIYHIETTGNLVDGTATFTPPTTIRRIRSLHITVSAAEVALESRLDSFILDYAPTLTTKAQPKFFAWNEEASILLGPTPDSAYAYTLRTLGLPTGLSAANDTTFIGSNHEDLILFATLVLCETFLQHTENAAVWEQQYQARLQNFLIEAKGTRITEYSGAV